MSLCNCLSLFVTMSREAGVGSVSGCGCLVVTKYAAKEMHLCNLQLIFLQRRDMQHFIQPRLIPSTGAFTEDAMIPSNISMTGLHGLLEDRLQAHEKYRAGVNRVQQRAVHISEMYVELLNGEVTHLVGGDLLAVEGVLRIRENAMAARDWDASWVSFLPLNVVEELCLSCSPIEDVQTLCTASATASTPFVLSPIRKLLVVIDTIT